METLASHKRWDTFRLILTVMTGVLASWGLFEISKMWNSLGGLSGLFDEQSSREGWLFVCPFIVGESVLVAIAVICYCAFRKEGWKNLSEWQNAGIIEGSIIGMIGGLLFFLLIYFGFFVVFLVNKSDPALLIVGAVLGLSFGFTLCPIAGVFLGLYTELEWTIY